MAEKLRNTAPMLFDIYADDLHTLPMVCSIYAELAESKTKGLHFVNKVDIPLLRYIALIYDKNSPIRREPLTRRKMLACDQADFRTNADVEAALGIKNDRVVALIHYYLRFQNDHTWTSYVLNNEVFYQNSQIVLKGASDPKEQQTVMALMKSNEELRERIKKYEDEIFGDNKEMLTEIINFYPEDFVDELEKVGELEED